MRIRIGTRGSALALWQTGEVWRKLHKRGHAPEIVTIETSADARQDVALSTIGGKGLFIKELEEALLSGHIDIAVHSLKDVPSIIDRRFALSGFLAREDPRDVWVSPRHEPIVALPPGSVIGTSAPRRRAQLMHLLPHVTISPVRGNVETRIRKARAGVYDGLVLASAGLTRLCRTRAITSYFTVDEIVPAAGQGIVAIETLASRDDMRRAAASITHLPTARVAFCERAVLQYFGSRLDCHSSIAVHATIDATGTTIRAFAGEGVDAIRVVRNGSDSHQVAREVYMEMIERGAMRLLSAVPA